MEGYFDMAHLQSPISNASIKFEHFHKTLPMNASFVTDQAAWNKFLAVCLNPNTVLGAIEDIPAGVLPPGGPANQSPFNAGAMPKGAAPFVSPMAAWADTDGLSPDPAHLKMPAPPSITSRAIAAEMNELYWMSALRDSSFDVLGQNAAAMGAVDDINAGYNAAIDAGEMEIVTLHDIPVANGRANFTADSIFRAGLPGELDGPPVSQFFLRPINYGAQLISPAQIPYTADTDYLYNKGDWLLAQNTGLDTDGNPYNRDNDNGFSPDHYEHTVDGAGNPVYARFYIRNMRDLCRFVNRDALHQAYFNAALLLNNWGAPLTPENPLRKLPTTMMPAKRQGGFATLGGPDILALVSWMACDAIRTVWHQKWRVWLRLRPEALGGIATVASNELGPAFQALSGLKGHTVKKEPGNFLLPIAFSAGSPAHPSYGAGHATVAGACVTMLKAWFDGCTLIKTLVSQTKGIDPPLGFNTLKAAGNHPANGDPPDYTGADGDRLMVEGELNKLAANVAMGRSMGGVHFRTDNTRSLRLGELVTTVFLANFVKTYKENPAFEFNSFDGASVRIDKSGVKVDGASNLDGGDLVVRYNTSGHI